MIHLFFFFFQFFSVFFTQFINWKIWNIALLLRVQVPQWHQCCRNGYFIESFRSGNFNLQNKPRGRPKTQVDNEKINVIVKANPSQTTSELATSCGVSDKTDLIHLTQIGKIKKLERFLMNWVKQTAKTRFYCWVTFCDEN